LSPSSSSSSYLSSETGRDFSGEEFVIIPATWMFSKEDAGSLIIPIEFQVVEDKSQIGMYLDEKKDFLKEIFFHLKVKIIIIN
jgi:hypothetical protein